jgi:hypothetical protein
MDTLRHAFFEDPLYVYIALALAALSMAVLWHEQRRRMWLWSIAGVAAAAMVVFLVSFLVVTDREKIADAAENIARAVTQQRLAEVPPFLDDAFEARFSGATVKKYGVEALCRSNLVRYDIRNCKLHAMKIEVHDDQATMRVTSIVFYGSGGDQRYALIWDVIWMRRPDGWKILSVSEPRPGAEIY